MSFVRDERAVSNVIVTALLLIVAIVGVGVIASFMGGVMDFKKTPVAEYKIMDDPDPVADATATQGVIIIRHLGGDGIPYNELVLAVYNSKGDVLYQSGTSLSTDNGNVVNITDKTSPSTDFNGGDQIFLGNGTIGGSNNPGTYEVVLYYKPTMQPLVDKKVTVS